MSSSRRAFIKTIGLGAAGMAVSRFCRSVRAAQQRRRPNIIFFLVDDMGWMDSTVYGSQYYETPNMERLAERGMVFSDAYAANPLCSPTRASIMTGKYPARLRITTPSGHLPPLPDEPLMPDKGPPGREVICPRSRRFLPLEEYTIAEALRDAGYRTGFVGKWHLGLTPEYWPEKQGFEFSFHGAPDPGPRSYFSPYGFRAGTITDGPPGEYITDRLTDEALKFITENSDRPFFLCLWHFGVHGPWGHKEEITRRFRGKKDPRGKQGNPVMASMLYSIDESLGRIMDKLDELKIADDTMIIFFSDNGGNIHSDVEGMPPTNNYPLRGGKAMIYEGGTRVPCIIAYPRLVKPRSKCSEVISSIDFYPTILEMAGVKPREGQVIDGESIVPLLKQTDRLKREAIFCHFPHGNYRFNMPGTYVRKGDWKLIRFYETNKYFPNKYELYNLKDDIGETRNLADEMPQKVKELDALIDEFLKDTNALVPVPNPDFDPMAKAMEGWVNRGCEVRVENGILHIRSSRRTSFIAVGGLRLEGAAVLKLRAKSRTGARGEVRWRTRAQREFPKGQVASFEVPSDGEWHEVSINLPVRGWLLHIRLFPSTTQCEMSIDWIQLLRAGETEPAYDWQFGGK